MKFDDRIRLCIRIQAECEVVMWVAAIGVEAGFGYVYLPGSEIVTTADPQTCEVGRIDLQTGKLFCGPDLGCLWSLGAVFNFELNYLTFF